MNRPTARSHRATYLARHAWHRMMLPATRRRWARFSAGGCTWHPPLAECSAACSRLPGARHGRSTSGRARNNALPQRQLWGVPAPTALSCAAGYSVQGAGQPRALDTRHMYYSMRARGTGHQISTTSAFPPWRRPRRTRAARRHPVIRNRAWRSGAVPHPRPHRWLVPSGEA